jgi:ribosome-binding protein aMBF1 (putative translation factor)
MSTLIVEQDGSVYSVQRSRDRNVKRGISVIASAPVGVQLDWLRPLSPHQQICGVTTLLSKTRTGLLAAIASHDLPGIVEGKRRAGMIQEIAKQLRLSREIQYDATELVRRSERGLGVAIRVGQQAGTVETTSDAKSRASRKSSAPSSEDRDRKTPVNTLLTKTEQTGGRNRNHSVFAFTDGVTDDQFEEVIAQCRTEKNLSRAHVARKAKEKASIAPAAESVPTSEEITKKVRKTAAARRVVVDLTMTMISFTAVLNETDPQEVDGELHKSDFADIRAGLAVIRKFLAAIENERKEK